MGAAAIKAKKLKREQEAREVESKAELAYQQRVINASNYSGFMKYRSEYMSMGYDTVLIDGQWWLFSTGSGTRYSLCIDSKETMEELRLAEQKRNRRPVKIFNTADIAECLSKNVSIINEHRTDIASYSRVMDGWYVDAILGRFYQVTKAELEMLIQVCTKLNAEEKKYREANPIKGDLFPVGDEFFTPWKED